MAYFFLTFAHLEALSGIIALLTVTLFLASAGQKYSALTGRLLALGAGLLAYGAMAGLGVGAGTFLTMVASEPAVIVTILLLALTVLEGIAVGFCVVTAGQGETQRRIAVAVCGFASIAYIHGYYHIWNAGQSSQFVPLFHFILFTGAAVTTGVLMLYRGATK